jgi:hypothetical protein
LQKLGSTSLQDTALAIRYCKKLGELIAKKLVHQGGLALHSMHTALFAA